jgi:hypothetical protein
VDGNGGADEKVRELARATSAAVDSTLVRESVARAWFGAHRDRVAGYGGLREVTTIAVPAGEGAAAIVAEIRRRLSEGVAVQEAADAYVQAKKARVGLREWVGWEDLVDVLREPVFEVEVEGVTRTVEQRDHLMFAVMHGAREGEAESWDDPEVKEIVNALVRSERRREWERRYLERLKESLARERMPDAVGGCRPGAPPGGLEPWTGQPGRSPYSFVTRQRTKSRGPLEAAGSRDR